mmetsp:Transcript_30197/g.96341  ORF Transcript_30197/g.96341 Transcript_30197/m.96341 type:complete len:221 (-) Transcript_30197:974-1636(-)
MPPAPSCPLTHLNRFVRTSSFWLPGSTSTACTSLASLDSTTRSRKPCMAAASKTPSKGWTRERACSSAAGSPARSIFRNREARRWRTLGKTVPSFFPSTGSQGSTQVCISSPPRGATASTAACSFGTTAESARASHWSPSRTSRDASTSRAMCRAERALSATQSFMSAWRSAGTTRAAYMVSRYTFARRPSRPAQASPTLSSVAVASFAVGSQDRTCVMR